MRTDGSTTLEPLRRGLPPADPAAITASASITLPARYEAVGSARHFTRTTLRQWNLEGRFDDVALVVSELVTNALRHALPADVARDPLTPPVRLQLAHCEGRLVCAVRDPSRESPVAGEAEDSAESGRGLFLVESFSDSWGWHPDPAGARGPWGSVQGKVVWAVFHLTDAEERADDPR
ncbi:ATP-binding protein [Streptomyces sp. NBC_01218]|uniref:ATP-binding protein n=1 Tax=unclassified Streptomyces TaxID=2593676 RepID=UPI0023B9B710|nr:MULTISPECIES: ATP-binding protein [unclassified Streptomyces]WEH40450.1 ATP-binding protein [Streptomyces sp. AM 2-1-1]WSQ52141.1 ATP-binding protein [Streptomyces sp. NBC_01218]